MYVGATVTAHAGPGPQVQRNIALGLRVTLLISAVVALAAPQVTIFDIYNQTTASYAVTMTCNDATVCGQIKGALAFAIFALLNALAINALVLNSHMNNNNQGSAPNDALLAKLSLPLSVFFLIEFSLVADSSLGDAARQPGCAYGAGFAFAIIGCLAALAHYVVSMKVAGRDPFSAEAFANGPGTPYSVGGLMQQQHAAGQGQFDPYTGAPLAPPASHPSGTSSSASSKFDPHTGAPIAPPAAACTSCGLVSTGAPFCQQCGTPSTGSAPFTVPQPSAYEPATLPASQPAARPPPVQQPAPLAVQQPAPPAVQTHRRAAAALEQPHDDDGAAANERTRFGTGPAADQRKIDPHALVGARVRVFDGEAGERVGTVVGVNTTFGGSTTHDIVFEGGDGTREPKLLQKGSKSTKGLRFHVLEKT
jgi:hypothetical protein